ncbi:MAG: protein-L-isoaspartate(D-aspartate) O-methyltransferase [Dehalococcoidia bacterium]
MFRSGGDERRDRARADMLALLGREIADSRVIAAFAQVPREEFVPLELRPYAYEDRALPIGEEQTISQPLMVALMTQALKLEGNERVLEIGTGSGYQAAILSLLAAEVFSVERIASLREPAAATLSRLGYRVSVNEPSATLGWPQAAPYDAIVVTAAASEIPLRLLQQLTARGRLVVPVGQRGRQKLLRVTRYGGGTTTEDLGDCAFVPLVGESGFDSG